jgi:hypothetical protein
MVTTEQVLLHVPSDRDGCNQVYGPRQDNGPRPLQNQL